MDFFNFGFWIFDLLTLRTLLDPPPGPPAPPGTNKLEVGGVRPTGKSFRFVRECERARRGEAARASERRVGLVWQGGAGSNDTGSESESESESGRVLAGPGARRVPNGCPVGARGCPPGARWYRRLRAGLGARTVPARCLHGARTVPALQIQNQKYQKSEIQNPKSKIPKIQNPKSQKSKVQNPKTSSFAVGVCC